MTPDPQPHTHNGSTTTDDRPQPPAPGRAAPRPPTPGATIPPPPPHEAPFADFGAQPDSSKAKPVAFAAAGLLAGVAGGFAVGRATAPRRRGLISRLPFGVKRRAVVGGIKLTPVFVRGTYKTGKTAGKAGLTAGKTAGKASKKVGKGGVKAVRATRKLHS